MLAQYFSMAGLCYRTMKNFLTRDFMIFFLKQKAEVKEDPMLQYLPLTN